MTQNFRGSGCFLGDEEGDSWCAKIGTSLVISIFAFSW